MISEKTDIISLFRSFSYFRPAKLCSSEVVPSAEVCEIVPTRMGLFQVTRSGEPFIAEKVSRVAAQTMHHLENLSYCKKQESLGDCRLFDVGNGKFNATHNGGYLFYWHTSLEHVRQEMKGYLDRRLCHYKED